MAYINVNVDIDLDDIDTDDLVLEVCKRLGKTGGRKYFTDRQIGQLKEMANELMLALNIRVSHEIEVKTLDDVMKYEHLAKVFKKYPTSVIETLLP